MQPVCIVTHRGAPGSDRRANLDAVLAWLARSPELDTIVVEQDTHPRLAPPLPHPGARIVFAYNAGPFNRAWGLNVGARMSTAAVLAFGDADVVVRGGLASAFALCSRQAQVAKPYRRVIDLTAEESARVREGGPDAYDDGAASEAVGDIARPGKDALCGGWFAMRRSAFEGLGGFDERFAGSGGEDEAMTIKVERARLATYELDGGPALRLWRPPAHATAAEGAHFAAGRALLDEYGRYDDGVLERVAAVGRQTCGRRDKYRPAER